MSIIAGACCAWCVNRLYYLRPWLKNARCARCGADLGAADWPHFCNYCGASPKPKRFERLVVHRRGRFGALLAVTGAVLSLGGLAELVVQRAYMQHILLDYKRLDLVSRSDPATKARVHQGDAWTGAQTSNARVASLELHVRQERVSLDVRADAGCQPSGIRANFEAGSECADAELMYAVLDRIGFGSDADERKEMAEDFLRVFRYMKGEQASADTFPVLNALLVMPTEWVHTSLGHRPIWLLGTIIGSAAALWSFGTIAALRLIHVKSNQ
ncbi:MAG: hypothetical protein HUU22_09970 [Phycisphaerae bacterium]|nr:hypothetical protein [Phycisphaerae bacterium]